MLFNGNHVHTHWPISSSFVATYVYDDDDGDDEGKQQHHRLCLPPLLCMVWNHLRLYHTTYNVLCCEYEAPKQMQQTTIVPTNQATAVAMIIFLSSQFSLHIHFLVLCLVDSKTIRGVSSFSSIIDIFAQCVCVWICVLSELFMCKIRCTHFMHRHAYTIAILIRFGLYSLFKYFRSGKLRAKVRIVWRE